MKSLSLSLLLVSSLIQTAAAPTTGFGRERRLETPVLATMAHDNNYPEVVRHCESLIEQGVLAEELAKINGSGQNALHAAIMNGNDRVLAFLLEKIRGLPQHEAHKILSQKTVAIPHDSSFSLLTPHETARNKLAIHNSIIGLNLFYVPMNGASGNFEEVFRLMEEEARYRASKS